MTDGNSSDDGTEYAVSYRDEDEEEDEEEDEAAESAVYSGGGDEE